MLKDLVNESLNKVFTEGYQHPFDKSLVEIISQNDIYWPYMSEGFKDGSGGYYTFMAEYVSKAQPKHIVELGNREGLGTLSIYHGIQNYDCKFTTIDIINDLRFVPKHVIKDPKVDFVFGDVLEDKVIQKVKESGPIDFILFDTIHSAEQFEKEWKLYEPLLADEAVALVDDVNLETKHLVFDKLPHDKINDRRLHSTGFGVIFYKR